MAYSTGSFSGTDTFATVQTKLKNFASAQGWTVNNGSYPALQLSKGSTFVNLNFNTTTTVDDTLNTGASVPDYRIIGYLSEAYPAGVNNGVDSLVNDPMVSNDWTGPYSSYWLFSGGDGDANYIYMVVQKSNGRFCCIMFGCADKKGIDYDGGDFITGTFWNWWFVYSAVVGMYNGSLMGSDAFGGLHGWPGDAGAYYNIRLKDACAAHPYTSQNFGKSGVPYAYGLNPNQNRNNQKPTALESYGYGFLRWQGMIAWLGPNPINGVTPLFEVPIDWYDGYIGQRMISLGTYPNYRTCSMIGRQEAETVTFGSDSYLVFPIKRALIGIPEPFAAKTVTSSIYGHAFKIIT